MIKYIIFDFDGTIADTFQTILEIGNRLSIELGYGEKRKELGLEKITKKDIEKMRNSMPKDLIKKYKFPMRKLPFVLKRIRQELNKKIAFVKPIKNIKNVLWKLKNNGYKMGILTSTSEENVRKFLKKNKLELFDFIYSGSSIFGKHKVMKSLLKKQKLKRKEVIYVGDETRDIEAAKKAKVKIISVTWGFNTKQILKKQKPDFLIDKPKELMKILK